MVQKKFFESFLTDRNGQRAMSEDAQKIPRWVQIQQQLRQSILCGDLPAGERIPTEHALAAMFGVNRHTIRRAVAGLAHDGLLRVEQGRGMYVPENVLFYPIGKRTRFTETAERQNRSRGRRIISTDVEKANASVAKALRLRRGQLVIHLRSIAEVDGRPVSLSDDYFSRARLPDMAVEAVATQSITAALRRCGIDDYFRKITYVTARMPDPGEAEALRQPKNRPVLLTESIDVDRDQVPLAFGITCWAGDRVQLVFET